MAIRFVCRCGMKLKVAEDKVGKKVLCGACGRPVVVPEVDAQSPDGEFATTAQFADGLLRVAGEDKHSGSKTESEHVHADESTGGIDVGETIRYLAQKFVPGLMVVGVITWVVYWASSQVFQTISPKPPTGLVTGQVTLNGRPLVGATIIFQPVKDREPVPKVAASFGKTDGMGKFSLTYVRNVKGAAVGEHRIEIRAPDARGAERVPDKFNTNTELFRVVEPGENELYFHLATGKPR